MRNIVFRASICFGFAVIVASIAKGGYDRAYISGYTEGVTATVAYIKMQKQKPEIKIDTIYIDTLTRGHWKI